MCALTQPEPVHLPKNGVCGPVAADKNAVTGDYLPVPTNSCFLNPRGQAFSIPCRRSLSGTGYRCRSLAVETCTPLGRSKHTRSPLFVYPIPSHKNAARGDAKSCQNLPDPKSQKPAITRAPGHFLLDCAGQCRTSNHSHSIVAGGLLDTSYVTREIPSISLMMRPLTVSSSS